MVKRIVLTIKNLKLKRKEKKREEKISSLQINTVTGCAAMLYSKGNPYYYKEENLKREKDLSTK